MNTDYIPGVEKDQDQLTNFNELSSKELFNQVTINDIVSTNDKRLVQALISMNVAEVNNLLLENRILSVPVYNPGRSRYEGFIDILDIMHYFLDNLNEDATNHEEAMDSFQSIECNEICDFSNRNPFYSVEENAPLRIVLALISRWRVHRIPVISKDGLLVNILTQSRIVRFLHNHIQKFKIREQTVEELGFLKETYSVKLEDVTYEAFNKMREHKISALAVVDNDGKIVDVISSSDIKSLFGEDIALTKYLKKPVSTFLQELSKIKERPDTVITLKAHNLGTDISETFFTYPIHRIYVVDDENYPIGVISMTDYVEAFKK
eukprot:TRINITY_DN5242_c0_g1_i1.p1 TRINITY_DN5242_c0_g1~~TRINITY_DN5242_c0_g1_i1.p1  ORF type:complete len:321 (-),score=70.83 TRINITY_DN5242_c0_g1_i1:61-1023(-)